MPDRSSSPDIPGRDAPLDDDWEPEVDEDAPPRARSRRKLMTPLTIGLCGLLLATAGFIAGVQVQKHQGGGGGSGSGAAAAAAGGGGRAAFARAGAGGGGRGAFAGGGAGAGGAAGATGGGTGGAAGAGAGAGASGATAADAPTVGSVANKKGSTLYVTGTDGTTVKVKTNAQSKVTRNAAASPKGIYPGDTVVVQSTKDKSGDLVATQITATSKTAAASGGGGFGGLRQAFGGGGGGAAGSG